jgi:preprotein translocase YajC subunit
MQEVLFQIMPLILIFFVFYFLIIRPQQNKVKEHAAMVNAVKKGDEVVTQGGLIGKVLKVSDDEVTIDFGDNVNIRAVKSTLAHVNIPFLPKQTINLGLDLRGGSYLLLEVDTNSIKNDRSQSLLEDIRSTFRQNKIKYSGLKTNKNGVQVTIRDELKINEAKKLVQEFNISSSNLFSNTNSEEFSINVNDNFFLLNLNENSLREKYRSAVSQSIEIIRRRIDGLGVTEPSIQRQGNNRILLEVPGMDDPQRLKDLLGQTAKLNFRMVDTSISANEARQTRIPSRSEIISDTNGFEYLVMKKVLVSGERLVDAQASFDQATNAPIVNFRFDTLGGKYFAKATSENVGKPFAIILDNEVISAPVIRTPILGGSGQIEGGFTVEEANNLSILLRAGALPAPLEILEEKTIGPGLGKDSIDSGTSAAIIGLVAVLIFIILSYGRFGFYANFALILNIIFIVGILSLLQATLTLPGIAGIVLTIGMAVDANVIIFERIRDEINNEKNPISAVESGYSKSFGTILDANVTTLIASLVLFFLGTGPVKGFAVTLSIGIITSVFTAFIITRLLISIWILKKRPEELSL